MKHCAASICPHSNQTVTRFRPANQKSSCRNSPDKNRRAAFWSRCHEFTTCYWMYFFHSTSTPWHLNNWIHNYTISLHLFLITIRKQAYMHLSNTKTVQQQFQLQCLPSALLDTSISKIYVYAGQCHKILRSYSTSLWKMLEYHPVTSTGT